MLNEGKDYFINKKEAYNQEKFIKNMIKKIRVNSCTSENLDVRIIIILRLIENYIIGFCI